MSNLPQATQPESEAMELNLGHSQEYFLTRGDQEPDSQFSNQARHTSFFTFLSSIHVF